MASPRNYQVLSVSTFSFLAMFVIPNIVGLSFFRTGANKYAMVKEAQRRETEHKTAH
jgi:hypothetical protein